MADTKDLGERIRAARLAAGHDVLAQCGRALGIADETLWRWENGKVTPGVDNLRRLSDAFGVSLDWLVKGEGEGPAEAA